MEQLFKNEPPELDQAELALETPGFEDEAPKPF